MNEAFSEYFAIKDNPLSRIDARIKMVFIAAAIAVVVSSPAFFAPAIVAFLVVVTLLSAGMPLKIVAFRLSAPFSMALTLSVIKIFFCRDSLNNAALMTSKIIGAASLVLFLSMTTALDKLLAACCWFKVPKTWIEISLIAYRYVFVLLEDAVTVFNAQKARLGYNGLIRALSSVGILAGMVVIRAYDQSVSIYEAMVMRGYTGEMKIEYRPDRIESKDIATIFIFGAILALLFILNGIFKA